MATVSRNIPTSFFNTKRGRVVRENLVAYSLLAPAGILMFVFGIFPVAFAFFVSLHRWRRFPGEYFGLGNYERGLGNLGYFMFFWIAVGALVYGISLLYKIWKRSREEVDQTGWFFILPGVINTVSILLVINWFFPLLRDIMEIPRRIRGQDVTLDLFLTEFGASLARPEIVEAGNIMLLGIVIATLASFGFARFIPGKSNGKELVQWTGLGILFASFFFLMQLSISEMQLAITDALASGDELPIWTQLLFLTVGGGFIFIAFRIWRQGTNNDSDRKFVLYTLSAITLAVGGFLLISEVPNALASADEDLLSGFLVTVMYALGTVPFQLAIGLFLAYVLFQDIKGRAFFRMMYFIPYITPFVATSIVFKFIFSSRDNSIINQVVGTFGIEPQQWLLERTPVLELMTGVNLPEWVAGPSLALVVIILYSIWTYVGYDAVIFLAGLGNIPGELYEAARIDGASSWKIFRHITFPLLSPTTFFLTLIAIIGTFKAFTQLWIMRTEAAGASVDTASIYIFEQLNVNSRYGYASSMAFILFAVILILTLFQNRLLGRKVFYG